MTDPSPTHRWRGVLAVTLVAGGLALVAKRPALLSSAVVGVVFVAYARVTSPPSPALELDRRLDEASPSHGDQVDVRTTVRNVGDRTLFDLRIVDGVPPALAVVEGTPRHGTVLRPGEATTFSYTVAARRGRHRFEPATVVARDVGGSWEVEVQIDDGTTVDCTTDVPAAPLRGRTLEAVGRVLADDSGAGTEFHQTREYRRGDALSRVDWNRYASTGDLTTIEFRKEQATRVILVVDARPVAYRAPEGDPHAVSYAVAAAGQLARAIVDNRNHVGLAAFGREPCWLEPGTGRNHALRVQQRLADHAAFGARPPDDAPPVADQAKALQARLENGDQLLVLSPLLDDDVVETVRRFEAEETPVSVLSPDVTDADGGGRTLARIERDHRHRTLRRAGVRVVDWDPERPLSVAVTDAMGAQQ
mgnify:CR=1 FL=1